MFDDVKLPAARRVGPRLRVALRVLLAAAWCAVLPAAASAYGVGFYYPYYYPHFGYYYEDPYHHYWDNQRLRRELRRQRFSSAEQQRQRNRELNSLRRQAFANQQTRARQACHYRTTGGYEVCTDLFADEPAELKRCEALVVARNPSCNEVPLKTRHPDIDAE